MFSIRRARISDLAEAAALENAAFSHNAYPAFVFRQLFDAVPDLFFVAEGAEGSQLGYAVAALQAGRDEAVLLSIAVAEQARGTGIGSALIEELATALASLGASSLMLTVEPVNVRAIAVYEKAGFAALKEDPDYFGPGDGRIVMGKTL